MLETSQIRVLILGAGKGGQALLELFASAPAVEVVGVVDINPDAPGMLLARNLGIATATEPLSLIRTIRPDLIVDVTGDAVMAGHIARHKPPGTEVLGGTSALLVWKLAQYERELRHQLIQVEKLATIGTLASGIAHEINNPLYAITGLSEHLIDETRPEIIREYILEIIQSGRRIASIVQDLNAYTRRSNLETICDLDLSQMIEEAVKMARRASVLDEVHVKSRFLETAPVRANPDELLQVFVNLVTNAVQAMNGKGLLTVSTSQSNGTIRATIQDSGPGIDPSLLGKIFDPFFTTKDPGKGTGLGLHIVRDIVTRYGGKVTVESVPGQGSSFTVNLPAAR
ncbi:MAG: GHKL domain-containing protein [Nitrospirae bacterium]|nr:MAG: GHKL domain-containing protein [Nitrospirota bacterium]